jgi:D-alanine transaminase
MDTAFVNGEFVPTASASVSIFDRGFLFADSVYEVVPVYRGRPFRLGDHFARLANSLAAIGIADPYSRERWRQLVDDLIAANGGGDQSVYIQITRGAPARREHRVPIDTRPTVVAFCQSRVTPRQDVLDDGVAAISRVDTRWAYCRGKSTSLLANVLATAEAHDAGAAETFLVDAAGGVVEGASSNVFAAIGGQVVTPALRDAVLPGITRGAVLEILTRLRTDHAELDHLPLAALRSAQEIWISSSTREILPVTALDGAPVGNGRPGRIWAEIYRELQADTP